MNRFVSILLSILGGIAVIFLFESIGMKIYPPPPGLDVHNETQLNAFIQQAPFMQLFFVIIGWAAGALAGGFLCARLKKDNVLKHAMRVSLALMVVATADLLSFEHPLWFWITGLAVFIPFTIAGFKLAGGRNS